MAPRANLNLEHQTHSTDGLDVLHEESKGDKNAINGTDQGLDEDADGESVIPFRTSKRLQGAIYRMIQQREGRYAADNNNVLTKDSHSSAKKQQHGHSSPERSDVGKKANRKDCEYEDSTPSNVSNAVKEIGTCRKRKRKNCTVHFADPLVTYIKEKIEAAPTASGKQHPIPSKFDFLQSSLQSRKAHRAEHAAVVQPTRSLTEDNHQQRKHRPLSCFDLLCNHVGPRGWRCYRTSMEGKYFCSYHQNRKAISFEKGISQTVCT